MIGIVNKKELDLRALPLGELPVTDLGCVIMEVKRHRKFVETMRQYRELNSRRVLEYQAKHRERRAAL